MVAGFGGMRMRRPRRRGSAMALYALFIAFVGVPLMVATVDVTRLWLKRAQLAGAVEAACSAYANTPDVREYREKDSVKLGADARSEGWRYFAANMPDGTLTDLSYTVEEDNSNNSVVVAYCRGEAFIKPLAFMGFVTLRVSQTTTVKAKYGTSTNWPSQSQT
jgi:hypothetical protein